jgi:hypothetical protein
LLKHVPAPPRSNGQRLELVEGTSPRGLKCNFADKAGNILCSAVHLPSCSSPAAKASRHRGQPPGRDDKVLATHHERRRGQRPGHRDQLPAGNDLGTTTKYLRRTTSGAAGNGLGAKIKYLRPTNNERRRGERPEHHDQVPVRCRGHRPGPHDQVPAMHGERRRGQGPGY